MWTIAEAYAMRHGFAFESDCELEFRKLAQASSARVQPGNAAVTSQQIRVSVQILVAAMIAEAKAQGATSLHEWTLSGALAKICPLYPFC